MTKQEEEGRITLLNHATDIYLGNLSAFGITEHALGVLMPMSDGHEVWVKLFGDSTVIVNLVAAMISQLQPSDFQLLLKTLKENPAFALLRFDMAPDGKKAMVN